MRGTSSIAVVLSATPLLTAVSLLPANGGAERVPAVATCHGVRATIVGTPGGDELVGTPRRDVVAAGAGRDRIRGLGGKDLVCGGPGGDELYGGRGDDALYGGEAQDRDGADLLDGGSGNDHLVPGGRQGGEPDFISWKREPAGMAVDVRSGRAASDAGPERNDTLVVDGPTGFGLTDADDTFVGSRWRDRVDPAHGDDDITTLAGRDDITFFNRRRTDALDVVRLGLGNDRVHHNGRYGGLLVEGGPGVDRIWSALPSNEIRTGPGDDVIITTLQDTPEQVYDGGPGQDRIRVILAYVSLQWDMGSGVARLGPDATPAQLSEIEVAVMVSGDAAMAITGSDQEDRIRTADAPVDFSAAAGADHFWGSSASDTFDGGDGDDVYHRDRGGAGSNSCLSVEQDPTGACSGP